MTQLAKAILAAFLVVWCAGRSIAAEGAPAPAEGIAATDSAIRETASTDSVLAPPVFHIQLWDGHKTNWDIAKLADAKAAGITVIQNGWRDSLYPSRELLFRLRAQGLVYGAYIDTRRVFQREATPDEAARAARAIDAGGTPSKSEYSAFDPTYIEVVRRGLKKNLERLAGEGGFLKMMINSERNAPLSYDDLTRAEAVKAGAMKEDEIIPSYRRGVATIGLLPISGKFADPWRFLNWWDAEGGDRPVNRAAAEAARAALPGTLITTDPIMDGFTYGQYRGMDVMQDWVRVHQAPRDPLSIAYRCERLKAHVRHEGRGEVWIGPQLGTKMSSGEGYAAPADEFAEALWIAAAFGAKGVTLWGYDTVRRGVRPDDDTWSRIGKFKRAITTERAELIEAKDAPRACAVLLSKANQVLSGRVYYDVEDNYEHFYRCLLTAHVPADVLYDDDVLAGALGRYKAVFLPGLEKLTPEIDAAVEAYAKAGGRVIRWPVLKVRYFDYEIAEGKVFEELENPEDAARFLKSLLPHQYRAWRRLQAGRIFEKVSDLMDVRVDNPDVIVNVVESRGKRYAVLINDARTYGAWCAERRHRLCEDEGLAAEAVVTFGRGKDAKTVNVTLPPAGIALAHN